MKLVFVTAIRYVFSKKAGQRTSSVLIILSIMAGITVMIAASGIMNGLQSAQLDAIRAISSFDLKVRNTELTGSEIERAVDGSCYGFDDYPALVSTTDKSSSASLIIREIDSSWFDDPRLISHLDATVGDKDGLVLSIPTYTSLKSKDRRNLQLTYLKKGRTAAIAPHRLDVSVKGLYASNLYEFSTGYAFSSRGLLGSDTQPSTFGVYTDMEAEKAARIILDLDPDAEVTTWKKENNAVYSALMLEKAMMYIFLGCIFVIISIGLSNSIKRLIEVRRREGAILIACGMKSSDVMRIFVIQGMVTVVFGMLPGVAAGCIIVHYIPQFLLLNAVISFTEVACICCGVLVLSGLFCIVSARKAFVGTVREVLSCVSC